MKAIFRSLKRFTCSAGLRLALPSAVAAAACGLPALAFADSPITSTGFSEGYRDLPELLQTASGILTPELALRLTENSLDRGSKIAIVNALGWLFEGKSNAAVFIEALMKKYGPSVVDRSEIEVGQLTTDELVVLGYLKVMDDYFHPARGLAYLDAAEIREPRSLGVAVVRGLIRAQLAGDVSDSNSSECQVWKSVAEPLTKPRSFKVDMNLAALKQPLSYMQLYKESCKK